MKTILFSSVFLICATGLAHATGIEQAYQSPRGMALGNAVNASVDDASAIHYNVAGLAGVEQAHLQVNSLLLAGRGEYSVAAGTNQSEDNYGLAGSLFIAMPVKDNFGIGFGLTTPHGLKVDWGDPHPLRSLGYQGELKHVRASLGAGWQVLPTVKIGASVVYARDDFDVTQGLLIPGDGFTFAGHGGNWGWTAGIQWEVVPRHTVAVTYRSAIDVNSTGTTEIVSLTPLIPNTVTAASLEFPYPSQVVLGYAFEPNDKWLFEFNWQHTDWNSVDILTTRQAAPFPDIVQPQFWDDGEFFSFGVSYQMTEKTVLRIGYLYGTETVPDAAFGPLIPDAPYHAFSFGVGVDFEKWSLDAAMILSWREDRTVSGSMASPISPVPVNSDGFWESTATGLFVGVTIPF